MVFRLRQKLKVYEIKANKMLYVLIVQNKMTQALPCLRQSSLFYCRIHASSIPGLCMWDLWSLKEQWFSFFWVSSHQCATLIRSSMTDDIQSYQPTEPLRKRSKKKKITHISKKGYFLEFGLKPISLSFLERIIILNVNKVRKEIWKETDNLIRKKRLPLVLYTRLSATLNCLSPFL